MAMVEQENIEAGSGGEGSQFLNENLPTSSTADREVGPSYPTEGTSGTSTNSGVVHEILRQTAHPTAVIFHILFKIGAVASYILIGLFTSSFVIQFVVTVTLLALDFWTVKNVTGRLLVGLRWWHDAGIGPEGISGEAVQQWRFETVQDRETLNKVEMRIFWISLFVTPLIWVLLGIVCILKFSLSYLVIVVVALVLSAANIIGYHKCDKSVSEQVKSYVGKSIMSNAVEQSGFGAFSQFLPK